MKKIFTAVLFQALLLPEIIVAQKDSSGIYLTPEDFGVRKLSYAIDCNTEKHRINSDLIFKDSKIKVKHNGQKYMQAFSAFTLQMRLSPFICICLPI